MNVYLIHGIHTTPDSPFKGLIPYLQAAGLNVRYIEYGYELAVETKFLNPIIEGCLLPCIEPSDILIGHSNGCAISYHLLQQGAAARGAVFINGALEQNITRPETCHFIDVYFNAGDGITEVAKIGEEIGIVDQDWGEMGHAGYNGDDPWIHNFDCGATSNMPIVSGHSDFFSPANLAVWGPFLVKRITA